MSKDKRILLSAGGTGGHVMPAAALALDLTSRGYAVEWATDERGLKFKEHFDDIPVHVIKSGTLGGGIMGKIKGLAKLGFGILQAQKLIHRTRPSIVVGFGGYPSFPALYAAQKAKIPTILHEQNAIIGRANDMLSAHAERIASSVPELQGIDKETDIRTVYTGNPVREQIAALYTKPYPELDDSGVLRILVMGGSLGAKVLAMFCPKHWRSFPPISVRGWISFSNAVRSFWKRQRPLTKRLRLKPNSRLLLMMWLENLKKRIFSSAAAAQARLLR